MSHSHESSDMSCLKNCELPLTIVLYLDVSQSTYLVPCTNKCVICVLVRGRRGRRGAVT
jgi:hypothetical protein